MREIPPTRDYKGAGIDRIPSSTKIIYLTSLENRVIDLERKVKHLEELPALK